MKLLPIQNGFQNKTNWRYACRQKLSGRRQLVVKMDRSTHGVMRNRIPICSTIEATSAKQQKWGNILQAKAPTTHWIWLETFGNGPAQFMTQIGSLIPTKKMKGSHWTERIVACCVVGRGSLPRATYVRPTAVGTFPTLGSTTWVCGW